MSEIRLQKQIQEQLIQANQYLYEINCELAEIKKLTSRGGIFDDIVNEAAFLTKQLCELVSVPVNMGNVTLDRVVPSLDITGNTTQNATFY